MKNVTQLVSDYVYKATNSNKNTVQIDMRDPAEKAGQSPMELILSAISGCVAVEVVLMLKKKRKTVNDLVIESEGTRRDEIPKSFTHIHLKFILTSPDASEEDLFKVSKLGLEKYCSVASSLNAEVDFSVEVRKS